ncbi:glycosyltransferase [Thalassotalea piscium]
MMKKDLPSILITSNLYKPNIGGVENSLTHLADAYITLGYQPIIVASDINSTTNEVLPFYEEVNGTFIYRYSTKTKFTFLGVKLPLMLSVIFNAIVLYKKIHQEYKPHITITRYHFNQLLAKTAGLSNIIYLVPGVVKFQNTSKNIADSNVKSYVKRLYHMGLQYLALRLSDRVSVFSNNMIDQVNAVKKQKFKPLLTKPGVDGNRFFPKTYQEKLLLRDKLDLKCDGKVFLCIGRFVKAKGIDIAIKAFAQKKSSGDHLWVVGDGPLSHDYQELVEGLGLTQHVKFLGVQEKPENFYSAADFFIMSSIYEPLGQTILEAMSSGLPVLAFKPGKDVNTASNELMTDEHCLYIDDLDITQMAAAIDEVVNWQQEKYQKVSNHCRNHVLANYTWASLATNLVNEFVEPNYSPLVSVYIPTKNRLDLLQRAIKSVEEQTYKNIEIVVVDDGSVDGTKSWLKAQQVINSKLKIILLEQSIGAPNARNKAIQTASGELITGLDDDDYFLPKRIEHLVTKYDSKYAFVCSGYFWSYGKNKIKLNNDEKLITLSDQLYKNYASNQVLINRQKLISVGGYDGSFVSCQDWDLWTKIIKTYGSALRISEVDYVIDVNHGNNRITDNTNRVKGFEQFKDKYINLMSKAHLKSITFHILVAKGEKFTFKMLIQYATLPMFNRNVKYWLSSAFPKIAKWRLDRLRQK